MSAQAPTAFYERDGDSFVATGMARGPWDPQAQHAGPPAALLAYGAERAGSIQPGQPVSLQFDVLRPVPMAPLELTTNVVRPGRSVELIEAHLLHGDAPVMRASVWRARAASLGDEVTLPRAGGLGTGPEAGHPGDLSFWPHEDGHMHALDWRFVDGGFDRPGPCTVWSRTRGDLIDGEPISALERLLVMADAASGASAELDLAEWGFANVNLGVHLARMPVGEWMAMAATTQLGDLGAGLCTSGLYDSVGKVGISTQSLFVTKRR